MNRRDFFKAGAALAASAALPNAIANPSGLTLEMLRSLQARLAENAASVAQPYFAIMHPSIVRNLEHTIARDAWYLAYKLYRKQRALGIESGLDARAIFTKYAEKPWTMRGSLGRIDGLQIITRTTVPR